MRRITFYVLGKWGKSRPFFLSQNYDFILGNLIQTMCAALCRFLCSQPFCFGKMIRCDQRVWNANINLLRAVVCRPKRTRCRAASRMTKTNETLFVQISKQQTNWEIIIIRFEWKELSVRFQMAFHSEVSRWIEASKAEDERTAKKRFENCFLAFIALKPKWKWWSICRALKVCVLVGKSAESQKIMKKLFNAKLIA